MAYWIPMEGGQCEALVLVEHGKDGYAPDHSSCDVHHAIIHGISPYSKSPAISSRHEAKVPFSGRRPYEVPANAQEDGGVQDERQSR